MARLPISRFGRGLFDFDNFFGKSLDFFDPFDRWDMSLSPHHMRSLNWIREPPSMNVKPINKFRVTIPSTGYDKNDITTSISDNVLYVKGRHVDEESGGFNAREFSREFNLPKDIDGSKLACFLTGGGMLVIEIPFLDLSNESKQQQIMVNQNRDLRSKSPSDFYRCEFMPVVIDDRTGAKKIEIDVHLPNYKPDEIQLTLKDRDLILKAETTKTDNHQYGRQYLYRQVTLPSTTNTDKLFSTFENGTLHIEAPITDSATFIPIQQ